MASQDQARYNAAETRGQAREKAGQMTGIKGGETLSDLHDLTTEQLIKQIEDILRNNWIPCLEFCKDAGENNRSPGYDDDGRNWTTWKLPMYGCNDAVQVAKELEACMAENGDACIRIIGFDNTRQVQGVSFIAYKPPNYE